jgi:CBS domain containing-hemolysin-like protein
VLGIVHIKDIFVHNAEVSKRRDLRSISREPLFVPESLAIEKLLADFQKKRVHMGIVIDEHGGTSGIVTLEDVVEELTGEIQDEFDQEEPKVRQLPDGSFSVDATLPLDETEEKLGIHADADEEVDTLGGLVFARLGRMPRVGDSIVLDGNTIKVSRIRGRRILRLVVQSRP